MLTAIGDVMRRAYEKGWITTRDGNISLKRYKSSTMYITPSGVRKTIIHPESIIKTDISGEYFGDIIFPPGTKPSGELEMHWLLQKSVQKTMAVVHLHPTNIISAVYGGWDMKKLANDFPEVSRYTKVGPTVPTLPVISPELAICTHDHMTKDGKLFYDIVAQSGHGVCAVGDNPWDAYEHIERLDHICEIVLKSGRTPNERKNILG
jgi:L-fuculose-phosphate aldolase